MTGKTSILNRYVDDLFDSEFISTIGVDFRNKTVARDGKNYNIKIWDTAGQVRFRSITRNYYRGCQGLLLVFDLGSRKTFTGLREWVEDIKKTIDDGDRVSIVIVGNKSDLPEGSRVVDRKEIDELCESLGYPYFEVSAKKGTNVESTFDAIIDLCVENWGTGPEDPSSESVITIGPNENGGNSTNGDTPGKKCC